MPPGEAIANSSGNDVAAAEPAAPAGDPEGSTGSSDPAPSPKSAKAAVEVLTRYAARLAQRQFAEARQLWSDEGRASGMDEARFARRLGNYASIDAEVGVPGRIEGAAGSSYVDIPVRFSGSRADGSLFRSSGTATLRRTNEVPGSTAEQRQWRIYRLDLQPPL